MSDHDDRIEELLTHGPWLEQLAHRLVNDPHTAQDAVQSTWLNALRRPPDRGGSGRAWLRTVLVREVHLAHRKRNRSRTNEELARADEDLGTDPASEAEASELRAELVLVLRGIAEPFRTTLRLHFLDELSSKEIAEKLGIPAATVRWRVMTGLERLRAELRRRHPDRPLHVLLLPLTRLAAPGALDPAEADGAESSSRPSRRRWIRSYAVVAGVLVAVFLGQLVWRSGSGAVATADLGAAGGTSVADASLASSPSPGDRLPGAASPASLSGSAVPAGSASSASPGFEVEVEVADADGLRQSGAAVLAFRRSSRSFEEIGRTDASGRATLGVDPEDLGAWGGKGTSGRVALRASAPGWAVSDVVFASVRRGGRAVRLVLPAREVVFEGEVVDDRGLPVPGADVEVGYAQENQLLGVVDADPSMPHPVRSVSDEQGRFRAAGVDGSSGRVRVHAWREGHVPAFLQQIADGTAEKHCRIVLSRGGTVRGEIRRADGEPVASARIWHEPEERGGDAAVRSAGYVPRLRGFSAAAETDAAGKFEMRGVPAGAILLWAQDPASPGLVAAGVVDVALGETSEWNAQVELREPLRIDLTGVAESSSGWIVRVWFAGPDGRRCIREHEADTSGVATFFDAWGREMDVSIFAPDTGFLAARTHVASSADSPVHLQVDPPALLEGRLVDAKGAPQAGGVLRLVAKGVVAPWTRLPLDPGDASFSFGLPSGTYELFASQNGSNVRIATFTLESAARLDLGAVKLPALGHLRIECRGAPGPDLEYRIMQENADFPLSINPRVEIGAWPPPLERDLLPGRYRLEAGSFLAKDLRLDRSWPVEVVEGGRVTLTAGL